MCGLFGIINIKKSKFDKTLFNVLGIQNDSRGGDSCGIFIDGKTEYGVNDKKLYSKFYKTSEVLKNTTKCKIALGHCRKASVGTINESTAQPVVLKDSDGNIEFVVMHNGTIFNYKALAQKYIPDVDITNLTDSQVMARIFYHKGYDCLSEYYGGAVFVIVDYRNRDPKVMLFKGCSKSNSSSTIPTEERPFYFVHSDDTFIFSSIGSFLAASTPDESVWTLKPNELVEVKGDDIYIVSEHPRDNVMQTLPSNASAVYYRNTYGYCDDDFYDWDNYNKKQTTKETETPFSLEGKSIRVTTDGIYHIDNIPAHGKFIIDCDGKIYATTKAGTNSYWFWDGVLLYGNVEYIYLQNACKHFSLTHEDIKWVCPEILNYLSPYPMLDPDYIGNNEGDVWLKCNDLNTFVPYTGSLHRLLEGKSEYYKEGHSNHSIWKGKTEAVIQFNDLYKAKKINFSHLYKLLN